MACSLVWQGSVASASSVARLILRFLAGAKDLNVALLGVLLEACSSSIWTHRRSGLLRLLDLLMTRCRRPQTADMSAGGLRCARRTNTGSRAKSSAPPPHRGGGYDTRRDARNCLLTGFGRTVGGRPFCQSARTSRRRIVGQFDGLRIIAPQLLTSDWQGAYAPAAVLREARPLASSITAGLSAASWRKLPDGRQRASDTWGVRRSSLAAATVKRSRNRSMLLGLMQRPQNQCSSSISTTGPCGISIATAICPVRLCSSRAAITQFRQPSPAMRDSRDRRSSLDPAGKHNGSALPIDSDDH